MEAYLDIPPFLKVRENWQVILNSAFRDLANGVVYEAQANIDPTRSGLHNRSGMLRDSIKLRKFYVNPGGESVAEISAGNAKVPYARIHEFGGIIRPVRSKFLRFKIGERWISKTQVVMPARPYLGPSVESQSKLFDSYIRDAIFRVEQAL